MRIQLTIHVTPFYELFKAFIFFVEKMFDKSLDYKSLFFKFEKLESSNTRWESVLRAEKILTNI